MKNHWQYVHWHINIILEPLHNNNCSTASIAFPKSQRSKLENVIIAIEIALAICLHTSDAAFTNVKQVFVFLHSSYRSARNGFWNVNRNQTGHRSTSQHFSFTRVFRSFNNLQTSTQNINSNSTFLEIGISHIKFLFIFLNNSIQSNFYKQIIILT